MFLADYTKTGGFDFDQYTLAFIQFAYGEILSVLIKHLANDPNDSYIVSGCEIAGNNITDGWMIIDGELLKFESSQGNLTSKIKIGVEVFNLDFFDGNTHPIYTIKTAEVSTEMPEEGITLSDFVRIPNAMEFLTTLPTASESESGIAKIATQAQAQDGVDDSTIITPKKLADSLSILRPPLEQATESELGIAKVATQALTNSGTDDLTFITPSKLNGRTATATRAGIVELATTVETITGTDDLRSVTPKGLKEALASLIPESPILRASTFSIGNPGPDQLFTISFPSVQTTNYIVTGSLVSIGSDWNIDNDVFYVVRNKQTTSFQIAIREIESVAQNLQFDYALIKK